jgi:hypothetical protein
MSFLFHKRTKKVINFFAGGIAVILILSMVVFFAPGILELIVS